MSTDSLKTCPQCKDPYIDGHCAPCGYSQHAPTPREKVIAYAEETAATW